MFVLHSPDCSIISTYYFYYGEKINGKTSIIWASDDKPHSSPGSTRHSLRPEEDRVHLDTRAIKLCGTIIVLWRCFGCQDESQRKLAMASHKGLNRFMPQTHTASTNHICSLPCLIGPYAWGGRQHQLQTVRFWLGTGGLCKPYIMNCGTRWLYRFFLIVAQ